jgi:hypothetical protein
VLPHVISQDHGRRLPGVVLSAIRQDSYATLRPAKFDIGVRSSDDGKSAWRWTLPHPEDRYPPVNEARCSNKLLEHLEHLRKTNDLFGNVAKGRYGTSGLLTVF